MNIFMFKKNKNVLKKVLVYIILGIISVLALLISVREIYGVVMRYKHRIESPGIDKMETIKIGGIDQCLYIRGKDVENPILLFLHGGPGTPEMPLLYTFQYKWEDVFTVAHWDQRGTGKTYFANDMKSVTPTISFEQSLEDAWEVTQYLQRKYKKRKIVVLGYSWGSVLGTALVQTYPEAFSAYIGVGQVVNGAEGEEIGFKKAMDLAKAKKCKRDIQILENLKPYPPSIYDSKKFVKLRKLQIKYGLAVGVDKRSILSYFFSPYISIKELSYYLIDPSNIQLNIMKYVMNDYKSSDYGVSYSMPIIYILGENDYQTPTSLAHKYFEKINAPIKKIFILSNAGHASMMDKPDEFSEILKNEVLPVISSEDQ